MKIYRLNKSRSILQSAYTWYQKKYDRLSPNTRAELEERMLSLEKEVNAGNREDASTLAQALEKFSQLHCKKSIFDYLKEIIIAITVALVLAVVVRQMWFEFYEIPTGSMRPTFREQDRVAVTKTPFGINLPMSTGHLLFEPSLVNRGGVVTFTSEGIDRLDEDTTFMWVIPYKKRLVKRLIGKPGDSLYFYGGKIYGVDREGRPILDLLDADWMHKQGGKDLEHIPFIKFSGDIVPISPKEVLVKQMNVPIGRLLVEGKKLIGEVKQQSGWVRDDPLTQRSSHASPQAYSDFFGIRNFATARLLTASQVKEIDGVDPKDLPEGVLYLELSHHPSLTYPQPHLWQNARNPLQLASLKSILPLNQEHLDRLMNNMYTARLVFKNGKATRYSVDAAHFGPEAPSFPGVPDGTYEFYDGTLSRVGWGAIIHSENSSHPLASRDPVNVQKLFNLGIEMHNAYAPQGAQQWSTPSRYAYFRDGDLYLLGAPIVKKDDPVLQDFEAREQKREASSNKDKPYTAFKDEGAPLKNNEIDIAFVRAFGVKVPEKEYLLLGDNHAMSGDSRVFGFVPEANLQGAPSLIMWPAGERWGAPWQAPYALFVLPRIIIWFVAAVVTGIWYYFHYRRLHRPIILNR